MYSACGSVDKGTVYNDPCLKRLIWQNYKGYNHIHLLPEICDGVVVILEIFSLEVPKKISQLSNLM